MRRYLSRLLLYIIITSGALSSFAQRPHRLWSTYVGDGYNHFTSYPPAGTVIADMVYHQGYIYIAGTTTDTGYIATAGTYRPVKNPGDFIQTYLAKFDTLGHRVWGTYIGSTNPYTDDNGMFYNVSWEPHIAIDQNSNIYLAGTTICDQGIATPGAFQPVRTGPFFRPEGYLAKFSNQGQLVWGTYFPDKVRGIACDNGGNIYITGGTVELGIGTPGTFKPAITISPCDTYKTADVFLVKFNSNGQRQWGTYYGGNVNETAYSIAVAPNGDVLIAGSTNSNTGIATAGTYQTTISNWGCSTSGKNFIARFNSSGQRVWGTYFGDNVALGVGSLPLALHFADGASDFYIAGYTTEGTGMTTTGSFQPQHNGIGDAFLARFSGNGQQLIWGTYYGGTGNEYVQGGLVGDAFTSGMTFARLSLALTRDSSILISGATTSTGMSTSCAYPAAQPSIGFMAKFTKNGERKWGSYNDARAGANALAAGTGSKFYLGIATLDTGRATPSTWKTSKRGPELAGLLSAFSDEYTCPDIAVNISIDNDSLLHADPGFARYQWFRNNVAQPGDSATFVLLDTGSYYVVVTDSCGCVYTSKTVRPDYHPTAITELQGMDLVLYPNPSNGHFTLKGKMRNGSQAQAAIAIADITGRSVYQAELKISNSFIERTFDLSALRPGLYTIKVQSGIASGVYKMVKR